MQQRAKPFTAGDLIAATYRAKSRVDEILERACEIQHDERKEDRLKRHECRACFYSPRIGGAAMTSQPCSCCNKEVQYGSTATSMLCHGCAKEHNLCRHCGGDIEMRVRRKNWPGQ